MIEKQARPLLHYTPPFGWMNDPNGLFYRDGVYHLYYQADPDNLTPVSLHWGHATSADLVHWVHQPIALYPDEHGVIYSGNLLEDTAHLLTPAADGPPALAAFFTYHQEREDGYTQCQGLAYSTDGGYVYRKHPRNPVLTECARDFRDPMVFWDEQTSLWVMLVVAGRSVKFYCSETLTDWQFLSIFEPSDRPAHPSELWECPCLVKMTAEDGKQHQVLFVSVFTETGCRFGMRYFIGSFDGREFTAQTSWDTPLMLDSGLDFYAGIVYGGAAGRVLMQGWMNCWYYARSAPTYPYRGSMAFPRELVMHGASGGLEIRQRFPKELTDVLGASAVFAEATSLILPAHAVRLTFALPGEDNRLTFSADDHRLTFTLDAAARTLTVDRSLCGDEELGERYRKPLIMRLPPLPENHRSWNLDLLLDVKSVELLCDGAACTVVCYPQEPFTLLSFEKTVRQVRLCTEPGSMI